jgi:hypothetical protein
LKGLVDLSPPINAQEVQQFVCALNWIRQSIPGYNALVAPLQQLLDDICVKADTRMKAKLGRWLLGEHGWTDVHMAALERCKEALKQMVTLAHPDPSKVFCLYTDTSQDFCGAVRAQIPPGQEDWPVDKQAHDALAILSGAFKGAGLRWSTIEKEAFAIVAACKRLDYLLHRQGGFLIYTDHRNLKYVFGVEPEGGLPRYLSDKLARWAVVLSSFNYKIQHVTGEDNI